MLLYAALFLYYSQTDAFSWDEAYHLLGSQLILLGKQPYLDFCFPQTPLNAYWNAFWMSLLGQSWRVTHALAALLTMSAVHLTADFVARQFPVPGWRIACGTQQSTEVQVRAVRRTTVGFSIHGTAR